MAADLRSGLIVTERSYAPAPRVDRHPFYQVVLPRRGRLEMEIAGERGYAGETRFALVPAGIEHRYWANGPNRFLILDLSTALITDVQRGLEHRGARVPGPFLAVGERLATLGSLLRVELARGGLDEPLIAESLGLYTGSILFSPHAEPTATVETSIGARRLAMRTRDFLETSYVDHLSIRDIAAAAGASASHVQRCFRTYHGTTIVGYLRTRRLERARELLLATDLSITEVAFASGFNEHGYFTRLFTREVGIPPSTYRRSIRAGMDQDSHHSSKTPPRGNR